MPSSKAIQDTDGYGDRQLRDMLPGDIVRVWPPGICDTKYISQGTNGCILYATDLDKSMGNNKMTHRCHALYNMVTKKFTYFRVGANCRLVDRKELSPEEKDTLMQFTINGGNNAFHTDGRDWDSQDQRP